MPTPFEFLQAILPPSGRYCATEILNGHARNYFVPSIVELDSLLHRLDARNISGLSVYHACASYQSDGKRTQDNVVWIKSFWLDIDVGEGKGYDTLNDAIDKISIFIGHYGLPIPILVCSGVGLHAYWPLEIAITRQQWEPYAQALKNACHEFGLKAGPERTADAASILRPPGSTHRKGSPKPVTCGALKGPYRLEQFDVFSQRHANSNIGVTNLLRSRNSSMRLLRTTPFEDYTNIYAPEPIDFGRLTDGCGQFALFKNTRGNIPEPLWFALLGVLGFAFGGDKIGHEWSSGHPKYSYVETQGRLDRVKKLSGPSTCAHIKGLNPKCCEGCVFGQSTPLEAGRIILPQSYQSEFEANTIQTPAQIQTTQNTGPYLEGMAVEKHPEYQFKKGALYHVTQNISGSPVEIKLASYPVRVASVHVGEINKEQYYYLFQHYKPHNGWHDVIVKPSQVHGQGMQATMADLGIVVHDPVKFHLYIKDSVDSLNGRQRAKMSYEQFGWKGDSFLYGDRLYGPQGPQEAAISPELRLRSQWLKPTPGGSLAAWKGAVDCLMGRGSEGMSFTILASFASVFMPFFEANEGGAVINLMTRQSGTGKTTSLAGASTVWASDPRALELISIDTKVSQAISLGALCNLPCIYDEFDNKDPEKVREFMVMFTSGRDKLRGNSDATLTHTASSWRTMLLAASNASIVESIISIGRSEAPAMRVLELPVESSGTMKPSEMVALSKQLYANAGWAGEAFIQYLVQPGVLDWVRERLSLLLDEIFDECGFKKEHRFWARALASIGCAAIIVEELGLISFSTDRIMKWALEHFRYGARTAGLPTSMLEYLAAFLNASVGETLTVPGPSEGRKIFPIIGERPRGRVSVRIELRGGACYISEHSLRKWLETNAGGGYRDLLKELQKYGMLIGESVAKTITAGTEIEGGQVRCLAFDIGHPRFSGQLREVEKTIGHSMNIRKLK